MNKVKLTTLKGKKVESVEVLDSGFTQVNLADNLVLLCTVVGVFESGDVEEEEEPEVKAAPAKKEKAEKAAPAKKAAKKAPEPEPEEEDEDEDEDEEELDIEEVKQALLDAGYTKKEVKGLSDDELIEAYEGLEEEDEEDGEEDEEEDEDWD